jgi:hypothetical protein
MLTADAKTERLLESLLQFGQGAIRLFMQLSQQRRFHGWRYPAHHTMAALRDSSHLLAAQPLTGNLLGPVIADRKQLCQCAQRSLPAIISRQQLASKIIRIGLRHLFMPRSPELLQCIPIGEML